MSSQLRMSPLHSRHVSLGAKMSDFGGWEMPIEYPGGGVLKEHAAVREAVGLFDVSHLGKLAVTGPASAELLNQILTNDLERISPGRAQYSLLCDESGGVVDDLIVYLRAAHDVLLVPNANNAGTVLRTLSQELPSSVTLADQHESLAVLAVQGPKSIDVLRAVGLGTELGYMEFADTVWDGHPLIVCRTGYTGEVGFELLPRWEDAGALWDALVLTIDEFGGRPAGLGARDTLRTEMGYPLHGQDLTADISPVQARLGWAVGWDKPTFRGRAALIHERTNGPARRLWGIKASDRGIPRPNMDVFDTQGGVVGRVTSGTFSPTLRQGIGLALLNDGMSEGDQVEVDVRGRRSAMTVMRPPFVPASTKA